MSSEEDKPLRTVDPAKLQQMRQQTEGKYKMTMEAFKRNTGQEHSLAGTLGQGGAAGEGKVFEGTAESADGEEKKEGEGKE